MSHSGTPARGILDAWRQQHADRLDPIRFHFMDALERRAASHDGEARRILDGRLSALLAAYADELDKAATHADSARCMTTPDASTDGALGELIDLIADRAASRGDLTTRDAAQPPSSFPELGALADFKKIWSKVRTDSQLRQSLEQAPANAGPLNSGALVHRSIALMRELSPGYLQQFLAYIDALAWIEQLNAGGALTSKDTPPAVSARKRTRNKTRSSQD